MRVDCEIIFSTMERRAFEPWNGVRAVTTTTGQLPLSHIINLTSPFVGLRNVQKIMVYRRGCGSAHRAVFQRRRLPFE
jgi:hypothetical protein